MNTAESVDLYVRQGDDGACVFPVGLSTCGSVWACPVCSAKIRTRRAMEMELAAARHVANGGQLHLMTLTVRHNVNHTLAELMDAEAEAWRALQQSDGWREARSHLVGMVRSWEITHSLWAGAAGNGWHPHFHVLLFVKPGYECPDLDQWVPEWWADKIAGGDETKRPDITHGFDLRQIRAEDAGYVSKIADEVARSDLKGGSQSAWHIIDALQEEEPWAVRAWVEYVRATKGRRAIQYSRGLRKVLKLGAWRSDEEISKDKAEGTKLRSYDPRTWRRAMATKRSGQVPVALRWIEEHERNVTLSSLSRNPGESVPQVDQVCQT